MRCKLQKSSTFTQGLSLSLSGYDLDWTDYTAHDSDSVIASQFCLPERYCACCLKGYIRQETVIE